MDIEDAHKLKLLTTEEVKALFYQFFDENREKRAEEVYNIVTDTNEQIAYLRASVIGILIDECTRVFMENEEAILNGEFEGTLIKSIKPELSIFIQIRCNNKFFYFTFPV